MSRSARSLRVDVVHDPEGHDPALALRGDLVLVTVGDAEHAGRGEASHSGDDAACRRTLEALVETLPPLDVLDLAAIRNWHSVVDPGVDGMVRATAVSALDQALHELVALRADLPVWRLFVDEPCRATVPAYVTINRALGDRSTAGHVATVERAVAAGWREVKCAPFHSVTRPGDQVAQAAAGLETLAELRASFPEVALRVDCHERFDADPFLTVLPALDALGLAWIEAPCRVDAAYARICAASSTPIAAGELLFGPGPFREIVENGWADVILPDVKHVGGFGPLLEVCGLAGRSGVEVAPHNPSGPVATLASVHAAACAPAVTCVEIALRRDGTAGGGCDRDGALLLPDGPGWGRV